MKQLLLIYNYPQGDKVDYDKQVKMMKTELGKDYKIGRTSLINLEFWVKKNHLAVKTSKGLDLKKVDGAFFAKWHFFQNALAAAIYLKRHNVSFKPRQVINFPPTDKLGETAMLSDNSVLLPDTAVASVLNLKSKPEYFLKPFRLPVVLKRTEASYGNHNFLIHSVKELRQRIANYLDEETFMIQEFIPNSCDYRCLIFNGKLEIVIKRTRRDSTTHLNNTNKGAFGEIVTPIPPILKKVAEQAARLTGREDFAGVDVIIHEETGLPYVLEVNKMPVVLHEPERPEKTAAVASFLRSI